MDVHRSADQQENPQKNGDKPLEKPKLITRLRALFGRRGDRDEELMELVNAREDADKPPLSPEEKALVAAALEFSNRTAESVSIPRADMITLNVTDSYKNIIATFAECQHSRLPVIREDLDNVIGFITLKDMIGFMGNAKKFTLKNNLRPCTFVPDNLSIPKVLEAMRHDRVQLAIVVDEYGGTAGLITLKDIIEVLVGEMEDEHETSTPQMLTPVGEHKYHLDPRLPIEELEQELKTVFTVMDSSGNALERDYETAGGLVLTLAKRVPEKGEAFSTGNGYIFTVLETDARRIHKLELSFNPDAITEDKTHKGDAALD